MAHTNIKRLTIERFRGIKSLTWQPDPRVNIVLGGGDAGKTSILEAIALLFSPSTNYTLADTDYWERDVDKEFVIDALVALADWVPVNQQRKMHWPWQWNGKEVHAAVPDGGDATTVYWFRVRGTTELELSYEVVQPDGETESLTATLRRQIGLVRLSGDDRNDRDLRLVQGSALDRVLDDKGFRARVARELAGEPIGDLLGDKAKEALGTLGATFKEKALPSPVGLGLTGGAGLSLNALLGLTATKGSISLPLISWGAGTRRLASLTIAGALNDKSPITVVDELERGLECYRQRTLVRALQESSSQAFVTTHSATTLRAAGKCAFWYLDSTGRIGPLTGVPIMRQLTKDPEAFLSRFTVVAEGATEVGFISEFLEKNLPLPLADYGIHITDSGSNETAIDLLQALSLVGLGFGGMADDEGTNPDRWAKAKGALGAKLCRWEKGCLEEEVIANIEEAQLEDFIRDPNDELTGSRLRTLADRLEIVEKNFGAISAKAGNGLRKVIMEACCGAVPDHKKDADKTEKKILKAHAQTWFKSEVGGRELAGKVLTLGQWPKLQDRLLPFLNAVRAGAGLPPIESVKQ
jgi:putative ATP-dependent endonuclease of OLD family